MSGAKPSCTSRPSHRTSRLPARSTRTPFPEHSANVGDCAEATSVGGASPRVRHQRGRGIHVSPFGVWRSSEMTLAGGGRVALEAAEVGADKFDGGETRAKAAGTGVGAIGAGWSSPSAQPGTRSPFRCPAVEHEASPRASIHETILARLDMLTLWGRARYTQDRIDSRPPRVFPGFPACFRTSGG